MRSDLEVKVKKIKKGGIGGHKEQWQTAALKSSGKQQPYAHNDKHVSCTDYAFDVSQFARDLDVQFSVKELIERFEPSKKVSEKHDLDLLSGTSLIQYMGGKDGKVYKFQSLPLFLVQYNVLSMLDTEYARNHNRGFKDVIRRDLLCAELEQAGATFVGFQETRTSKCSFMTDHFVHICSGSESRNSSLGCELWITRNFKFRNRTYTINKIDEVVSIRISTSRILFVAIRSEIFKLNALVIHAPWCARGGRMSDAVKEKVETFWKELKNELEAMPDIHRTPLIVMADANARIGEFDNRVGSLAPDEVDFQGSLFLDFLSQFKLCVPQTFVDKHVGAYTHTLCKSGTYHRCDFLCVPESWLHKTDSAGPLEEMAKVSFLHPGDDHFPIFVKLHGSVNSATDWKHRRAIPYDLGKIKRLDSESDHGVAVMEALQNISGSCDPVAPSRLNSHVFNMGEMLRDFLCSAFPKPPSLPSKKFMSAESYDILGKRNMYKKLLTTKRKELRRAELREAFIRLAGHSCGALGY